MESRSRLALPGVRAGSVRSRFGGPLGVRAESVRGPFEISSRGVRGPCGVRAGSVRGPFGIRSASVRGPFGIRSGPETKNANLLLQPIFREKPSGLSWNRP